MLEQRLVFTTLNELPIVVNTTSDVADGETSSIELLRANPGADQAISLREAIMAANATTGHDTIKFNIPGDGVHTIRVGESTPNPDLEPTGGALPAITDTVTIDGYSQPGSSVNSDPLASNARLNIELDGTLVYRAGQIYGNGLHLRPVSTSNPNGSVIRGLVINNFQGAGISLDSTDHTLITGNFIGTDPAGTVSRANGNGIYLDASSNNTIGGDSPELRNVISGNNDATGVYGGHGILLKDSTATKSLENTVSGNLIGTDTSGNFSVPNNIGIEVGRDNTILIGGLSPAHRNVISGNQGPQGYGVWAGANTSVQGNFIGTNVTGNVAIGNTIGVFGDGRIGGLASSGAGNVISGNVEGVNVGGSARVQGNKIGTDVSGTQAIPNQIGVFLQFDHSNTVFIGGFDPDEGNLIAYNNNGNQSFGARVFSNHNAILGNTFRQNPIVLHTFDQNDNDPLDLDLGPNGLQNQPELHTATTNGVTTSVTGSLHSAPKRQFRIEFFANPNSDWSGNEFLGYADVATDEWGNATIHVTLTAAVAVGDVITATATDLELFNTSQFSLPAAVELNNAPVVAIDGPVSAVPGQSRTFLVSATDEAADEFTGFTYVVNFGDGSPSVTIPATPNNGSGISVDHVFNSLGNFTVSVTATDSHGNVSAPATFGIRVTTVAIQRDNCDCSLMMLAVGGTSGDDLIELTRVSGGVQVVFNSVWLGRFQSIDQLTIFALGGNDEVHLAGSIDIPALIYGGAGDDRLKGGASNDVLLGEDGDDLLMGGRGRDVLIGGWGADRIVGNGGEDILIAGTTDFDHHVRALCAIMAEWKAPASRTERISHLSGAAGGANGGFYLVADGPYATVHVDDAADLLTGAANEDWFFANLFVDGDDDEKDKITDWQANA